MPMNKVGVFFKKICDKDMFNAVNFVLRQNLCEVYVKQQDIKKSTFFISVKEI